MDNITHSLVGWTLGQIGLKRKSRKGLAALILGANMPDIDVFLGWAPWGALATHRGWTHSLLGGVLLMPPLLAGLLWLLDLWQVRRRAEFKSGLAMRFGWLLALSYIGALSHPPIAKRTVALPGERASNTTAVASGLSSTCCSKRSCTHLFAG